MTTVNNDLIAAIAAAVSQSLAATMGGAQPAIAQDTEFESKIAEAAKSRDVKVTAKAAEYVAPILGAFEDFGVFIQGRMLSNIARSARDGFFFSRRMAEFQQTKVDKLRDQRPQQGLEIDPLSDAENMLVTHLRNMEENEVLLAAIRQAWSKVDKQASTDLNEREQESFAKMVPNFDISERAYGIFDAKQSNAYAAKQKQQSAASVGAARALARTESHGFLDA